MQYLAVWWWNGHTINAVTQTGRLLSFFWPGSRPLRRLFHCSHQYPFSVEYVSAERVTTGRWQRRKNTKPAARSTCGASFHCRETVRFSRVRVVLSTLLSHHWQFEQRRSVDDGRGADSNLVLERGHHSWEHNGLRRRMEGPRTHTYIYAERISLWV